MVEFKSVPSSKRLMFRKAKVLKKSKPVKTGLVQTKQTTKPVVRKLAKLRASALKMTKLAGGKKTAAPKTALQFMKDAIASVQQHEANTHTKKTSLASAGASVDMIGASVGVVAAIVIMLLVLIFLIWGIVRSGQEMAASNNDWSASKLYFWFMIGLTALYIILNIVASSVSSNGATVTVSSSSSSSSSSSDDDDGDGATVVATASSNDAASSALYGVSGFAGFVVLIMAIIALARLGMKRK